MLHELFFRVGNIGPIILLFLGCFELRHKIFYLFYFFVGYFLNILLNLFLKAFFHQPRPQMDIDMKKLLSNNDFAFRSRFGVSYDVYGMPSGHAQTVFYIATFIYFVTKDIKLSIYFLLFASIVLIHRLYYQFHSGAQVLVGSIFGIAFGYFMYFMAKRRLMGSLQLKKDDNNLFR